VKRGAGASRRPNRIHLLAHANTLEKDLPQMGFTSATEYLDFVRAHVGDFAVTANLDVFAAQETPEHGGRNDDALRVRDLQSAVGDPATAAIVALSGGGWFLRILRHVDFTPLSRRSAPLWAFGFSEMTSLLNMVASYRCGRACYWLCPNYLAWKIRPAESARAAMADFWSGLAQWIRADAHPTRNADNRSASLLDVAAIAPRREAEQIARLWSAPVTGQLVHGTAAPSTIRFIGGCLSVMAAMLAGPLGRRLHPRRKWLFIEDLKEAPYRVDRYLAALGLAGWFDVIDGVLVGDFHSGEKDDQPAVLELLRWHLDRAEVPVVATRAVGHVWPMSPVMINRSVEMRVYQNEVQFRPVF
jgi:muramoyltetrapeptide carboxypeptidase LdcA involved in peptidoglycan recycling